MNPGTKNFLPLDADAIGRRKHRQLLSGGHVESSTDALGEDADAEGSGESVVRRRQNVTSQILPRNFRRLYGASKRP